MWFVPSLQIFMTAGSEICFFAAILLTTNCVQLYFYMNILNFQTSKIWTTFSKNLRAIVIVIQSPNSWYNMYIHIVTQCIPMFWVLVAATMPQCRSRFILLLQLMTTKELESVTRLIACVKHKPQGLGARKMNSETTPIWWLKKGITVPLVSCRFHLCFASPMCWGQKHWRRLSDQQPCLPSLLFLCFASLPLWGGGASGDGTWVAYSCHFFRSFVWVPLMFIDSLLGNLDKIWTS